MAMTIRDRFLLWIVRRCLTFMSDRSAFWLYSAMRAGYIAQPGLTRANE